MALVPSKGSRKKNGKQPRTITGISTRLIGAFALSEAQKATPARFSRKRAAAVDVDKGSSSKRQRTTVTSGAIVTLRETLMRGALPQNSRTVSSAVESEKLLNSGDTTTCPLAAVSLPTADGFPLVSDTPMALRLPKDSSVVSANEGAPGEDESADKKAIAFAAMSPDAQIKAYETVLAENQYYQRRIRELAEHLRQRDIYFD
jgi:hypothetical protein